MLIALEELSFMLMVNQLINPCYPLLNGEPDFRSIIIDGVFTTIVI